MNLSLSSVTAAFVLGAAAVVGCYTAPEADVTAGAGGVGRQGGASAMASVGLPCEVQTLLADRCASCHTTNGKGPMPLISYDDLAAPSKSDPTKTVAALALERIRSDASPMPPSGPRVAEPQEAAFAAWVDRGAPREACASASPPPGSPSSPTSPQSEPSPAGSPATACGSLDNAEWQNIYTTFLGPGTPGHCGNSGCHAGTNGGWSVGSNATASSFLAAWIQRGLVSPSNPSASLIASKSSPVVWFNAAGSMPEDNQTANPQAAAAIRAWLAAAGACDSGAPVATPSGGSATCAPGTVAITLSVTAPDPADYVEIRPSRSTVYAGSTLTECVTAGAPIELRSTETTTWTGTSCGRSTRCNLAASALTIAAQID